QYLAAYVDGDLLRKVAVGDRDGYIRDISYLSGQVRGHRVDALGEVLPHACDFRDLGLSAKLALGSDLARDTRHLRCEHAELADHCVHDVRGLKELALEGAAFHIKAHGLEKVTLGDGADDARHLAGRPEQIIDQRID